MVLTLLPWPIAALVRRHFGRALAFAPVGFTAFAVARRMLGFDLRY